MKRQNLVAFTRIQFLLFGLVPAALSQFGHPAFAIRESVNEAKLVVLTGNTRPEATSANDLGPVDDGFALPHLLLQLKRSPERDTALKQYADDVQNPQSSNYHGWLTPDQFAERYGVAQEDVSTVTKWLRSHGFTVEGVQANGMTVDFSGNAGQVREAFHTEIHKLSAKGAEHFANMSDPQIPAALEPAVAGIVSLHNFHPNPLRVPRVNYTFNNSNGTFHALVPGDIATIYNANPAFAAGYTGKGQSIMVVEDTYLYSTADWANFRKTFGLASAYPYGSLTQVSPQGALNCANPGFQGKSTDPGYGDDGEAAIDVEWASAAAPNAAIILAACTDTATTFGGLIALENVLNGPRQNLPSVVSISYGEAEASNGQTANLSYYLAYLQATVEGVTVFVSSGDEGAASADNGNVSVNGISVSGFTSTPFNVSVGGLDFGYTPDNVPASNYWSATNTKNYNSALSYIQEIPWNDSCAGGLVAGFLGTTPLGLCNNTAVTSSTGALNFLQNAVGGSGGPSGCATGNPSTPNKVSGSCHGYPKPLFQIGLYGNPNDGVRDIPDVALFASNGFWDAYYVTCWSNPDKNVGGGFTCTGAPSTWAGFGGTSVSSPIMAGFQTLINQKTNSCWGNANTVYYALAASEYGIFGAGAASCKSNTVNKTSNSCVFYDVTQGDNDVVCTGDSKGALTNCYTAKGNHFGVLSTSNTQDEPAYSAAPGWDFTSGIGSVNVWNLLSKWPQY